MTIAIIGSPYPDQFTKYIQHLIKKLESEHVKIIIEEKFHLFLKNDIRFKNKTETFDSYKSHNNTSVDFLFSSLRLPLASTIRNAAISSCFVPPKPC